MAGSCSGRFASVVASGDVASDGAEATANGDTLGVDGTANGVSPAVAKVGDATEVGAAVALAAGVGEIAAAGETVGLTAAGVDAGEVARHEATARIRPNAAISRVKFIRVE